MYVYSIIGNKAVFSLFLIICYWKKNLIDDVYKLVGILREFFFCNWLLTAKKNYYKYKNN